jgi:hypothetical protein
MDEKMQMNEKWMKKCIDSFTKGKETSLEYVVAIEDINYSCNTFFCDRKDFMLVGKQEMCNSNLELCNLIFF